MSFEKQSGNTGEESTTSPEEKNGFSGGEYLKKKYPDNFKGGLKGIIDSNPEYALIGRLEGKNNFDVWLDKMEDFNRRYRDNPEAMTIIKRAFHKKYLIKQGDIPESYFINQQRMGREWGYGDMEISEDARIEAAEVIIGDQKATLDNWIDYFFSADADVYPMWIKYWAMQCITKLSGYDKEKKVFGKRRNDTVASFPDLDREALAYVVDVIVKKSRKESISGLEDDAELKKLVESENFGKLYAYAVEKVTPAEKKDLKITEGEWVKYIQGSDHMPLVESLQGHGTGWCTAGEETARRQLQGGDFYVYYSKDKDGEYAIPRLAIRMEGNNIGEVRGIAPGQNLDPYIDKVVEEKLKEFPDAEKYNKKTTDMELLTTIDKKQNVGQKLTIEELRFLYEIDADIIGFGHEKDPRIKEIIGKRDPRADISTITGFSPEEISTTKAESMRGGIKFHYGDLDISDIDEINFVLPEIISGDFTHDSIKKAEGLILPKKIGGELNLRSLESAKGVTFPERVGGRVILSGLLSVDGLNLPKAIGGMLDLSRVEHAEGIELPESLEEGLNFWCLKSAKGIIFPKFTGRLYLANLTSLEDSILPESINGDFNLSDVKFIKNVVFPKAIHGGVLLNSLEAAENVVFPERVSGFVDLPHLKRIEGFDLPKNIGGILCITGLESVEDLVLPDTVGGGVYLLESPFINKEELSQRYPNLEINVMKREEYHPTSVLEELLAGELD